MNNNSIVINQNKGFSLVEILVSLAVSSIVLIVVGVFISTGTSFFNNTSRTIELQNELMEVSNKVNDSLMQATYIEIENGSSTSAEGLTIYTGELSVDKKSFVTGKNSAKKVEWTGKNDKKLYVTDTPTWEGSLDKRPYCYGNMVTNISVSFSEDCYTMAEDGSYIWFFEQPIIMEVAITVSDGKESRSDSKTITLRNKIDKLKINGNEYVLDGEVLRKK